MRPSDAYDEDLLRALDAAVAGDSAARAAYDALSVMADGAEPLDEFPLRVGDWHLTVTRTNRGWRAVAWRASPPSDYPESDGASVSPSTTTDRQALRVA